MLDDATGKRILSLVWGGAAVGVAQSLFSRGGPGSKAISALLYVALGWIVLPYAGQIQGALGPVESALVVAGGVIYSLGVSRFFFFPSFSTPHPPCNS